MIRFIRICSVALLVLALALPALAADTGGAIREIGVFELIARNAAGDVI